MKQTPVLEQAELRILKAIAQRGPYTHNLISLALSNVARQLGVEQANTLVRKYNLAKRYGIHEEKP